MNTGQMLLTISGLVLLSTLVLRMNNTYYDTSAELGRTKMDMMAVSLASSYMEEVKQKAFDENTVSSAVSNPVNLSSTLGKESGESRSSLYEISKNNYDDVDDYNGDSVLVILGDVDSSVTYNIKCKVFYFDGDSLITTTSKKFNKKITVTVTSNTIYIGKQTSRSYTDPVEISSVFSYWKFR